MRSVQTKSRTNSEGMLTLILPSGMPDTDLDVIVIMQAARPNGLQSSADREEWLRFIDQTAGCWQGEPFVRPEQGEFEKREEWT